MRRREFITLLGGAAVAWPFAARAQQTDKMRRIGVLQNSTESDPEGKAQLAAFRQRARELGWIEGRNIQIECRWTVGSADRARMLASELVGTKPDVILASGGTALSALLESTRFVPIVFVARGEPFVAALAQPGGNATGFTTHESTMGTKWLGILKEIAPAITRVLIVSTDNPNASLVLPPLEAAAASLGVRSAVAHVHDAAEIERSIEISARESNVGLVVPGSSGTRVHRSLIIALAARYRLPAIYSEHVWPRDGGLLSYGQDVTEQFRQAAVYVDRILRGESPADLPVQAPTKFELVINLKTARTLGVNVPVSLLATADEVIE